jgi:hypothetical protein
MLTTFSDGLTNDKLIGREVEVSGRDSKQDPIPACVEKRRKTTNTLSKGSRYSVKVWSQDIPDVANNWVVSFGRNIFN